VAADDDPHAWRHRATPEEARAFREAQSRLPLSGQPDRRRCDACREFLPDDAEPFVRRHDDCEAVPPPAEYLAAVERLKARVGSR
jgi:hypothetical protein